MHVATAALLLLFITALSAPLGRVVRIPLALLQIGLGILAELCGARVGFDPDVFMLLFIPPLLFADAYRTPMRELRQLRGPILALAVGLVVFTTLGCGAFIHWLVPPIPLPAAFALAAVLSPTDAVAVGSMIDHRRVPQRFLHTLSGEALLNDASGLVCFKFAAAATMTGAFSLVSAGIGFVVIALGGLVVGALLAIALELAQGALLRRQLHHAGAYLTFTALLPFAAYLLAEHLGTSGILAAVSAGLVLRRRGGFARVTAETRLVVSSVWDVITFLFNGMIFLLLGLQLPQITRDAIRLARADHVPLWTPPLVILLITLVLLGLRLVWIVAVQGLRRLALWRSRNRPAWLPPRMIAALAIAGVRGAVTLAAISSLVPDFPQRGLLVVLAAGVILCSLLLAALLLPSLLTGMEPGPEGEAEARLARFELARTAIGVLEREQDRGDPERGAVVARLLAESSARSRRLRSFPADDPADSAAADAAAAETERRQLVRGERLEVALRLRLLREQRDALEALCRADRINDETERLIQRELDFREETLLSRARLLPRDAELRAEAGDAPVAG